MGNLYIGTKKPKKIYIGTQAVKSVYIGTEKVWSAFDWRELYQEVAFIENVGDAYINLQWKPNGSSAWKIDCQYLGTVGTGCGVCGARSGRSSKTFTCIAGSDSKWSMSYGNNSGTTDERVDNDRHLIYRNENKCYIDGILIITQTHVSTVADYNFLLHTYNNGGTHEPAKHWRIYSIQCFDNGDTLVRDCVPVYRKADGEVGYYDIKNNVFYTKNGTGTFTKGPDV